MSQEQRPDHESTRSSSGSAAEPAGSPSAGEAHPGQAREPDPIADGSGAAGAPAAPAASALCIKRPDGTTVDLLPSDLAAITAALGAGGHPGPAPAPAQLSPVVYQARIPTRGVSEENIKRAGYACRAINEAMMEAVSGTKAYDFRTKIERISVGFDDQNPKYLMVNMECAGMANQTFSVLLDAEEEK